MTMEWMIANNMTEDERMKNLSPIYALNENLSDSTIQSPIDERQDKWRDHHWVGMFFRRFAGARIVFYTENHDSLHPKTWYTIKRTASGYTTMRDDNVNDDFGFFWDRLIGLDDKFFPFRGRGLKSILNITELPDRVKHLPMVFDDHTLYLFVIVNRHPTHLKTPRLYYNNLAFRQFNSTWKYKELDPNYTYTAFVAFDNTDDQMKRTLYKVIAEPYRDPSDSQRGPSYAFQLEYLALAYHDSDQQTVEFVYFHEDSIRLVKLVSTLELLLDLI